MSHDISPELAEALTELAKKAAQHIGAPEPEAAYVLCRGGKRKQGKGKSTSTNKDVDSSQK